MNRVVNQYDFTVIDYTTTQHGYLFTVGTTGSRSEEYRFIYIPYSRYPSVLMLDFHIARSISQGMNHDLVEAIRKDTESEEGFILLGDGKQSKTGVMHEKSEGSTFNNIGKIMEFSFEAERTALIEALELNEQPKAHRPNFLKDASLDADMGESWRVDNDKELKIVRNLGLTRRLVQNLGKIDPSKISFRENEFGMVADYADSAEIDDSEYELVISQLVDSVRDNQPDLDLAGVYAEVERLVGHSSENAPLLEAVVNYLRDTERSETIKAERVTRHDVELLYQDLLGIRVSDKHATVQKATITGIIVTDNHGIVEHSFSIGTRIDNGARLEVLKKLSVAARKDTFGGSATGDVVQALRDFEEKMLISDGELARRVIAHELTTHHNVLAKLKERRYPALLIKEMRAVRENTKDQIHRHNKLVGGVRVEHRYESILRPSDILWHPIHAHRIIDKNPTVTESGIILAHRDIDTLVHVERTLPWAVRDITEQMQLIDTLTPAQRIFVESMYVERDRPTAHRIAVVRGVVDREEAQQAYRDSTEYGFVFRDLQESRRVSKFAGCVSQEKPLAKRVLTEAIDVLSKYALGERVSKVEAYIEEEFYEGRTEPRSLLLPKVDSGAERTSAFDLETAEMPSADREFEHGLWLLEDYLADKETVRPTILHTTNTYDKNHVQKDMHLANKPLEFVRAPKRMNLETILRSIREIGRPTTIRDPLLDQLEGGGWLGNKEYQGYLDEDMIVGELLQDNPAVIMEMMIEAVQNAGAPAYLDNDFLGGVKKRIDALIDSGILTGSKDSTKSGIITLNLEGVKESLNGDYADDQLQASKTTLDGDIDESLTVAEKGVKESYLVNEYFEGTKTKETLHGEITEVIYGADYSSRPAIIQIEDYQGHLPTDRGLFPDDPEYMGSKGERGGITSEEYAMGSKYERGGYTSDEYAMGSNESREGELHIEFVMGSIPRDRDRTGILHEEYNLGTPNMRNMYLSEDYILGKSLSRQMHLSDKYSIGTAKNRELYINEDYSIGALKPQQSIIDIEHPLAILQLRQTFLRDEYSIGTARDRVGSTSDEYTLGSANLRQLHINDEYTIGTSKAQQSFIEDSMNEAVRGDRHGTVSDDTLFAVPGQRLSFLDACEVYADKSSKDSEIQIEVVADKLVHPSIIVKETVATKLSKGAHLHEVENNEGLFGVKGAKDTVTKLLLEGIKGEKVAETISEYLFGNKLPKNSFNFGDKTIFAVKGLKESVTIEDTLVGDKRVKDSYLYETLFATKNPKDSCLHESEESSKEKQGELEENLVADKPQYGYLDSSLPLGGTPVKYGTIEEENLFAYKGVRDTFLHNTLAAFKGVRDAELPFSLVVSKECREADIQDELFARKDVRDSHLHETIDDVLKLRNGSIDEGMLFGGKGLRYFQLIENICSYKGMRGAYIEGDLTGGTEIREGLMHEGESNVVKLRNARLDEDIIFASKSDRSAQLHEIEGNVVKERYGDVEGDFYGISIQRIGYVDDELTYGRKIPDRGFVVGDGEIIGKKLTDAGYTSDEYSLATHLSRVGYAENDYSLAHKEDRESYVERSLPVGTANARLSEIVDPESLVASFEERCAHVITGFIFAERPEARAEYLEQLFAFLPERTAHLMEIYHEAKMEPRDSFLQTDEHLAFRDQPAEGYLPMMDTMGQGLIYDYSNDLLDQGMNPEDWEGGFGVPEDYDPDDPFNVYYPYSKDMDALELSQTDDWMEFGSGSWERDRLIGKFYSKSDTPMVSGWYRNNFLSDKYKFSIDFKVDTENEGEGAGIIFKYYDQNNYWMFMVHGGDPDNSLGMRVPMQLYKVVGGNPTPIGSPMQPFKWEKDKWYKLSVSVMDGRIQIYTDSKLQYDLTGTD
ncbi:hypothetical protein BrL25_05265 [Brevibacillus laterosporus DSM 25]|uniref:hypothetical protein n=1 Tax=Brevibacillus laterosporus TaxID=1465 RepID=UPI000377B902|nr:hypothetical protein [Brevibacillus laterosporus]ATO48575.1 hypothetical protein BrL25_05265 [Brevibacillus laterosporus DSM 25]